LKWEGNVTAHVEETRNQTFQLCTVIERDCYVDEKAVFNPFCKILSKRPFISTFQFNSILYLLTCLLSSLKASCKVNKNKEDDGKTNT
jgi:hypothetical protein